MQVYNAAYGALLWVTYACNLSDGEDAAQQEHLDRDSEDEDEGESQRRLGRHDSPQNPNTHQLDAGEQMHAQGTDLEQTKVVKKNSHQQKNVKHSGFLSVLNHCQLILFGFGSLSYTLISDSCLSVHL